MTALVPAPAYVVVARAAWIDPDPRDLAPGRPLHATREGEVCGDYAAALAASWRLRPAQSRREPTSR